VPPAPVPSPGPAAAASPAAAGSAGAQGRGRGRSTAPPATAGARVGQSLKDTGKKAGNAPIFADGQKAAVSGGSIVVGLIAYAIGVNYLQHGWPGVTAWLKAKLMNQTSQDGNDVTLPALYFHTGAGAAAGSAGPQQAATQTGPTHPAAPTPNGGTYYA
jgi:hypothetical protein